MAKKAKPNGYHGPIRVKGLNYRLQQSDYDMIENALDDEETVLCVLEPEPENEADEFAIKVKLVDGLHIGYIERPVNKSLFKFLKMGARVKTCVLQEVNAEQGEATLEVEVIKPRQAQ